MELQITFGTLAEYNEALDFFNTIFHYAINGINCKKSRRIGFVVYSQQEYEALKQSIALDFYNFTEIENFNFELNED